MRLTSSSISCFFSLCKVINIEKLYSVAYIYNYFMIKTHVELCRLTKTNSIMTAIDIE